MSHLCCTVARLACFNHTEAQRHCSLAECMVGCDVQVACILCGGGEDLDL
jgi:hypothetical protein